MEPTAPTPAADGTATPPGDQPRPWAAIVLGVVAAVLAIVVVVLLATDDEDDDVATDETTTSVEETTTTEEATTTSEATTTREATTTTAASSITDEEAAGVIWPDPSSSTSYDTPEAAVAGVAEELLGFEDPVYGDFMQGDARSGEVEVRAAADGPATLVAVRQMSDDRWYALFAATSEVELSAPTAGSAVDHPLEVEGVGRGFEGQVRVAIHERGETDPLAEAFATAGSGEELVPFTVTLDWPVRGEGGRGVVVASTASGAGGSTWAATAVPVGFIGGD